MRFFWSQSRRMAIAVAAVSLGTTLATATPGLAQTRDSVAADPPAAEWYVVGNIGADDRSAGFNRFAGFDDRLAVGDESRRPVALGLTFSNAEADRTLSFTAPSPVLGDEAEDRFTFLVSGAYDWHTGTIVTPRFMAGVGVSYLDPNGAPTRLRSYGAPATDLAPAAQLGIGAEVSISEALDLNAEYRASVRGPADGSGSEIGPQVDQKFMIGAKIRF
ncbi:MAG: hypothetical protein ACMVO3_15585 [Thalassobaculum sp.]